MATKIVTPLESEEQKALFLWAAYRQDLGLMFAIPNGGSRHPLEAKNLRDQGVKAGVPDICLPVARHGYHGLFIELKRKLHGRVSSAQEVWLGNLSAQGYACAVCYGADEAKKVIDAYMSQRKAALKRLLGDVEDVHP